MSLRLVDPPAEPNIAQVRAIIGGWLVTAGAHNKLGLAFTPETVAELEAAMRQAYDALTPEPAPLASRKAPDA